MKLTLTRLLDLSKALSTNAGNELKDTMTYLAEFVDQCVRSLRNGLTFTDNFDCAISTVGLKHNTATIISSTKPVNGIVPLRVFSSVNALDSFTWYFDDGGRLTVKAGFVGSPTATINVTLLLLY